MGSGHAQYFALLFVFLLGLVGCGKPGVSGDQPGSKGLEGEACRPGPAASPYIWTQAEGTFKIEKGYYYKEVAGVFEPFMDSGAHLQAYDYDYFANEYKIINQTTFRMFEGVQYQTAQSYGDDFNADMLLTDLFPLDPSRWHSFTTQSPDFPTEKEYNDLTKCILAGTCTFTDNFLRVENTSGQNTLLFHSVAPNAEVELTKMSITKGLFCFAKGDHFWSSFRAKIIGGNLPSTLLDLESDHLHGYPGPRLSLEGGSLSVELKFGAKERYSQKTPIPFPTDRWVAVKVHFLLDDTGGGKIEVWQDESKVIDVQGRNLPLSDTILNLYEIGISASNNQAEIEIDDILISNKPL